MTRRWKLIQPKEVEHDERNKEVCNTYLLEYKEWGYVVNHTIKYNNASLLKKRLCELDEDNTNYSYSIYKEVIE